MTHEEAVRLVLDVVSGQDPDGEARELPLQATLAEVGFDSLALVSVVTGLESVVDKSFPDELWEHRPSLRIVDLVDAVERLTEAPQQGAAASAASPSPAASPLAGAARRLPWRLYSRLDAVLLARPLETDLPRPAPPPGIVLRRAVARDDPSLVELWPLRHRRAAHRRLRAWREAGYIPLAAFAGDSAVALDWLHDSDRDARVVTADGSCLGIDLRLREGLDDRGVGVALLAYGLRVARDEGYTRRAAYVDRENHRMRTACTALLGYRHVGTAYRTVLLGRTRWTWQRDGRAGTGPLLVL